MSMDPVDKAMVDSLVPEGSIVDGFMVIVSFTDPEGHQCWRNYAQMDAPVSMSLGLLELAKLDVIARSDTGLPIHYEEST